MYMERLAVTQRTAPSHESRSKLRREGAGLVMAKTRRRDLTVLACGPQVARRIQVEGGNRQQEPLRPEAPFKSAR